ncbi:hypothetical protein GCM10023165_17460 [Variovorax defluvii]|uniref:Uncharacterized protein n=1 Tax=Variovorax defluvii TaxID=913761 RepID=A0ABP8HFU1_9BURK
MRTDIDQQAPLPVSRPAKAAAAATRWLSYLTVNPISALAAFALTSGGLLVLFFFLRIGFMPDVDLATSTALLFAVALVGLGTVIVYMLVAVLPGVVTAYALNEYKIPPSPWTLASVIGSGVLMTLISMADAWLNKARLLLSGSWLGWLFAVLAVVFVMGRVWRLRWQQRRATEPPGQGAESSYWELVFFLGFSALVWLGGLITALQLAIHLARESSHSPWMAGLLILGWLALLVAANLTTVRLPPRTALIFAPFMGVLVFAVLVLLSEGVDGISTHALRRLGLAEVEHVDLVVRSDVCKSLSLTSSTALRCAGPAGESGILRNVVVRSRIGTQLVVEPMIRKDVSAPFEPGAQTSRAARLILKKEDVLMWARREGF